jgi:flagellar export protein FliJ
MAVSKSLRRLRDIRQTEEEHNQAAMESAVAELQRLEAALVETRERVRRARALVASSVQKGEVLDRVSGLEEIRAAHSTAKILAFKIGAAEKTVQKKRQELLDKRLERLQVETVCEAMQAKDTAEANRKSQTVLDDWHRSRRSRSIRIANSPRPESDIPLIQ